MLCGVRPVGVAVAGLCVRRATGGRPQRTYYEVLGVDKEATQAEIKKAYYGLARKMHPDANPTDPHAADKFNELSVAYRTLSNESRRRQYDSAGCRDTAQSSQNTQGSGVNDSGGANSVFEKLVQEGGLADVLGLGGLARGICSLFGYTPAPGGSNGGPTGGATDSTGTSSGGPGAQNSTSVMLDITFEQSVRGGKVLVKAPVAYACLTCGGTGEDTRAPARECTRCHGTGTVSSSSKSNSSKDKDAKDTTDCAACGGSGKARAPRCACCKGTGARREVREVEVHVPVGAVDGEIVQGRVVPLSAAERRAHAQYAPESTTVVFVQFHVREHPLFHREGTDVHVRVPITLATAALGGTVRVPLASGRTVAVRVPPGTQPGTTLRLADMGLRRQDVVRRGSCIVHLNIVVPQTVSRRGARILRQYEAEERVFGPQSSWWRRAFDEWNAAVAKQTASKQA